MKNTLLRIGGLWLLCVLSSTASAGACRISDFTDRPLASLNTLQRLSTITELTQTEFLRLKSVSEGDPNYDPLVASSRSVGEAQQSAWQHLESFDILNFDEFRTFWSVDYLDEAGLEGLLNCIGSRQPGMAYGGRSEGPGQFRLMFAHITPIGVEPITTVLEASHNIANIAEFEAFLEALGLQEDYTAQSFVFELIDPSKRAVLLIRPGWETPDLLYIPVYPTDVYLSQIATEEERP